MHVEVDFERLKYPASGLGQVSLHLLKHLQGREDLKLTAFLPSVYRGLLNSQTQLHSVRAYHKILSKNLSQAPVWHSLHQESHYWPDPQKTRIVLTIHDLNFLAHKNPRKIKNRLHKLQKRVDQSALITTISQFTKSVIADYLKIQNKEIRVIPNGAEPSGGAEVQAVKSLVGKKFLFALGVMADKKNFHVLIPMMKHLPEYELVIAGGPVNQIYGELVAQVRQLGLETVIHLPGIVDAAKRNWMYKNCQAVLVPSLAEGFGMPVTEAMSFYRPVICNRATSLPEVGGALAAYWDNFNPSQMAEVVRSAISREARDPTEYKRSVIEWLKQFQWQHVADQYVYAYRDALNTKR